METVINRVLPAVAKRQGKLGALLADGSVDAANRMGKGCVTIHRSEQRYGGPDARSERRRPRPGASYAVCPRGACHVATPMLFMEMGACYYPEIGFEYELEPMTDKDKPEPSVTAVELGSIEKQRVLLPVRGAGKSRFPNGLSFSMWSRATNGT